MDGRLTNSTALVTGASRGIGKAIAVAFAKQGADTVINYYPGDADEAAIAAEEAQTGASDDVTVVTAEGDVSDKADVQKMFDVVSDEVGSLDILVNNAGILSQSLIKDMPVDEWDRVVNTNLRGTFLCTQQALQDMEQTQGGSILNVASDLGYLGAEELAHYSASKGGIIAFTRAVAREVAPEIRVNAIAPGPVNTNLMTDDISEERQEEETNIPMGRLGLPEEVAPAAVFLASEESSFFTGQVLSPNGGSAMY